MRRMTRGASFHLQRSMLEHERPLLVGMTLHAGRVRPDSKLCLLLLEAAVCIVAIAAVHRAFENLVMERSAELRLCFGVARHAQLRLVRTEHSARRLSGFLMGDVCREGY